MVQNSDLKDLELKTISSGYLVFTSAIFKNLNRRCFRFLKKVFSSIHVNRVEIDFRENLSSVFYNQKQISAKSIIRQIFKEGERGSLSSTIFLYPELSGTKLVFSRHSKFITNWEVISEMPGRLRIRHPALLYRKECCKVIKKELEEVPGIDKAEVNSFTGSVLINYEKERFDKSKLIKIADTILRKIPEENKKIEKPTLKGLPLSTLTTGLAMIPGFGPYTLPLTLYNGWPIFQRTIDAIKKKKIKVDILDTAVVSSCLAFRNFGAAAFMVWVLDVADKIRDKTSEQSKGLLEKVFSQQAKFARILKGKEEIQISIEKIKIGDTVMVSTGEQIPIDGEIIHGEGIVDQSILTGESMPVEKKKGDKVFASTILLGGDFYVKAEKTSQETIQAQIIKIIKKSAEYKPKILSFGEKMADKAVIPTLGLSALGMAMGGQKSFLAILNADFGTGIRVAAPTSVLAHMALAARSGILIKKGEALETLDKIDTFLFDKTGTLTQDVPEVKNIHSLIKEFPEEKILAYAASAEERLTHPLAMAIREKAKALNLKLPIPKREESKCYLGYGVSSLINGERVRVGNLKFLEQEKIEIPPHLREKILKPNNHSLVLVSMGDKLAGGIELQASSRPEAYWVIKRLKERGIKNIVLISGDHEAPTREIAERLEIDNYFAGVLPQNKANFVREIQARGEKVAMVGDGINDGAALSLADVSISLKGASNVALDTADIIFMDGGLRKIDELYNISESLRRDLNMCFKLIFIPNILCISGALFRVVGLGASMILNNGFNMFSTLYAAKPFYRAPQILPSSEYQFQPFFPQ